MVRSPYVRASQVLEIARRQIQALKDDPELEKGLLVPRSGLEETLDEVLGMATTIESLEEALASARHDYRATMFRFKEMVMGNIEQAAVRYGRASSEREALGGKPVNVERGASKSAAPEVGPAAEPGPR